MIKSKLFDLLTEKDKEKLREICRLLSRSLTARDINECMTCLQKIDGGAGSYKIATIAFALYTISQMRSSTEAEEKVRSAAKRSFESILAELKI